MTMRKRLLLSTLLLVPLVLDAQQEEKTASEIAKATDFAIPSSPAFVLLDVTPSKVTIPSFSRDFKLDLLLKENKLLSDIAIEANPVWIAFFKDINYSKYRSEDAWKRTLSTLNVSVGTTQKEEKKSLAYSLKLNVFREKDPLADDDYINDIKPVFSDYEKKVLLRKEEIQFRLSEDATLTNAQRDLLKSQANALDQKLKEIDQSEKDKLEQTVKQYLEDNWNTSMLDVGYGKVYNYDNPSLDSLKLAAMGEGFWINGSFGIGRNLLFCAMYKNISFDSGDRNFYGFNVRYGGAQGSFFIEFTSEKERGVQKRTIAYGGEYRANANLMIEFGLRTDYDGDLKLKNLYPVVSINSKLLEQFKSIF